MLYVDAIRVLEKVARARFDLASMPKKEEIEEAIPIVAGMFCLPQYTQTIQPYEYGHPYSKKTCLWLKNLPPLFPTDIVTPIATWCPSGSYSKKHGQQHKGMFTTDRAKSRAKTFTGVANAMSEQWG